MNLTLMQQGRMSPSWRKFQLGTLFWPMTYFIF
jgi:hypothetical protein